MKPKHIVILFTTLMMAKAVATEKSEPPPPPAPNTIEIFMEMLIAVGGTYQPPP